jgi:hypothetical protein
MAELVAAGGAVCHTGSYDGPAWAEVFHHRMDGSSFPQTFPWELTNTDYFRRVLAQVGYALQPLVEATVKAHGVVDCNKNLEPAFKGNGFKVANPSATIVFQSQDPQGQIGFDAFMLIKHVHHGPHFKIYASLLGCTTPPALEKQLEDALDNLKTGRNKLAHMSLTSDTDWLNEARMQKIFNAGKFVVTCVGEYLKTEKGLTDNYAAANMERLEKQWQTHTASKYQRQNARPAIDSWKLFVGNLPAGAMGRDEKPLVDHLNKKMYDAGLCTAPGHPVISCNISKGNNGAPDYAFVELRNVEETNNCFLMGEKSKESLIFKNRELKIGRPKNDNKLYMALLARGLEDAAVALGASLADDAARQGVSSQLRRFMPFSEGADLSKLVELRTLKGHSSYVRCGVHCTFVLIWLPRRSGALPCFRTGGASCLPRMTGRSRCGTWRPASAWRR